MLLGLTALLPLYRCTSVWDRRIEIKLPEFARSPAFRRSSAREIRRQRFKSRTPRHRRPPRRPRFPTPSRASDGDTSANGRSGAQCPVHPSPGPRRSLVQYHQARRIRGPDHLVGVVHARAAVEIKMVPRGSEWNCARRRETRSRAPGSNLKAQSMSASGGSNGTTTGAAFVPAESDGSPHPRTDRRSRWSGRPRRGKSTTPRLSTTYTRSPSTVAVEGQSDLGQSRYVLLPLPGRPTARMPVPFVQTQQHPSIPVRRDPWVPRCWSRCKSGPGHHRWNGFPFERHRQTTWSPVAGSNDAGNPVPPRPCRVTRCRTGRSRRRTKVSPIRHADHHPHPRRDPGGIELGLFRKSSPHAQPIPVSPGRRPHFQVPNSVFRRNTEPGSGCPAIPWLQKCRWRVPAGSLGSPPALVRCPAFSSKTYGCQMNEAGQVRRWPPSFSRGATRCPQRTRGGRRSPQYLLRPRLAEQKALGKMQSLAGTARSQGRSPSWDSWGAWPKAGAPDCWRSNCGPPGPGHPEVPPGRRTSGGHLFRGSARSSMSPKRRVPRTPSGAPAAGRGPGRRHRICQHHALGCNQHCTFCIGPSPAAKNAAAPFPSSMRCAPWSPAVRKSPCSVKS